MDGSNKICLPVTEWKSRGEGTLKIYLYALLGKLIPTVISTLNIPVASQHTNNINAFMNGNNNLKITKLDLHVTQHY